MNELIIHSGMPKTGTSALQVFFAKNRDKLLEQSIDYFNIGDIDAGKKEAISSGNGADLARSFLPPTHEAYLDDSNGTVWEEFLKHVKNSECSIGLLSSEFFTNIPTKNWVVLKEELNKQGIILKNVFYVRRQDQFLMSSYIQRVKRHSATESPDEFISGIYQKIKFLRYFGFTKGIADSLGKENIFPRVYEKSNSQPTGIIGDFLNIILGYIPDWVEKQKTINVSPSPLEIKLMLLMNKYQPRYGFSDFLVKDSAMAGRSSEYQNHSILNPDLNREINDYFAEQNEKFFKTFLPNESFDNDLKGEYVDLASLNFSASEMLDIISGLIVGIDKRISKLENEN